MIVAICALFVNADKKLDTSWVPFRTGAPFKKHDTIQFVGVGGRPKIAFKESPFEAGTELTAETYTAEHDAGFGLTVKTDATVNKAFPFSCELILPDGQVIEYEDGGGDDVPVKNP